MTTTRMAEVRALAFELASMEREARNARLTSVERERGRTFRVAVVDAILELRPELNRANRPQAREAEIRAAAEKLLELEREERRAHLTKLGVAHGVGFQRQVCDALIGLLAQRVAS
ncbi:MAG: hypothetical protein HYZ11_08215 [Candidatus Tectomicrobia bacterium]|uniref:Uncharacterized protein n=1 Tax=Tectimicrobiota bacterium TaxID=2528274 RepID=A0A932MPX9_UNCTE|nr:hypothetical protein [Candidatus Tectomicrobia bacterium]